MAYQTKGYPKLASLMSNEKEVAVFRRFDDLNILSLLALQAEIIDLDKDLRREFRIADMTSNGSQHQPQQQSDAIHRSENFKLSRESNSAQYQKIKDLRSRLKEYSWLLLSPKRPSMILRVD